MLLVISQGAAQAVAAPRAKLRDGPYRQYLPEGWKNCSAYHLTLAHTGNHVEHCMR